MLDIKFVRANKELLVKVGEQKKVPVRGFIDELFALDGQVKKLRQTIDSLEQQRNALAKAHTGGKPSPETISEGKRLKEEVGTAEKELSSVVTQRDSLLARIPNIPSADTPVGADESDNVVLRQIGNKSEFSFTPLTHDVLGKNLGVIDNERAAKVAGSRFTYLTGELALLEFALIQYALSVLTNKTLLKEIIAKAELDIAATPFIPVIAPALITRDAMWKMARLEPEEERYHIPSDNLYLVGSAEHTLGAMHMDETFQEKDLPRRYIGFSPAFRREAGSYGKDVKGILRMHQFDKLEMESFCLPEHSAAEQDFFVAIQEHLMQGLGLAYQVIICSTGDQGGPDARHIDIETWLPGQGQYRETHSADLMTDYQARRLNTRVRKDGKSEFVHMNDATAFAIGRMLIAIMENYQRSDGSIAIPEILQPYVTFKDIRR
jgi:seryl-tRNA synthetase